MNQGLIPISVATLAGAFLSLSPLSARAATPSADSAAAPHIQFDNMVYDFGKAQPTEPVIHEFVFTNTGNTTLEINGVRPSCSCITVGRWTKSVAPGGTGTIPLRLNPSNFTDKVVKGATVTCNDPEQSSVYLQLTGSVWRPVEVTPRHAYFTVREGSETNLTKVIRIINHGTENIMVSEPEWNNPTFKAELKTVKPGKEFEVNVSLVPPIEPSRSVTPITLKTSSTNQPEVTISAYVMVLSAIQVMPQRIVLPDGPVGSGNHYSVRIRNNDSQPLQLSEPTVNADGVKVTMKGLQPGRLYSLQLTFPDGFQIETGKSVYLSIKSNSSTKPVIRVPIIQPNNLGAAGRP